MTRSNPIQIDNVATTGIYITSVQTLTSFRIDVTPIFERALGWQKLAKSKTIVKAAQKMAVLVDLSKPHH